MGSLLLAQSAGSTDGMIWTGRGVPSSMARPATRELAMTDFDMGIGTGV